MSPRRIQMAGLILLPVVLAMSLIAAIAFLLNRDNGMNARMVADQMDTDRARYAAEAGLQAVNADIQGRNCTGFYPSILAPKTNNNFGGASYSAYAVTPSGNTPSLVSTGTYNGTSVTLSRGPVIAYQSTPNSYTMQPDSAAGIDSWIQTSSSANHGDENDLRLNQAVRYPLLMIDLAAFPLGSLPLAASIALYPTNVDGATTAVSMYRLANGWVEGNGSIGVNWTTRDGSLAWTAPGGDYHPVAAASVASTTKDLWSSFDVTDLATAWLLGRYPNRGVILAGPLPLDIKYSSSDNASSAQRPKMTVTYLVPCGTTGPSN